MALAIKKLRLARGMTQMELCSVAGIDRVATVSELENGRGNPTLQTLEQIAEALGVPLRELFALDEADADLDQLITRIKNLKSGDRASIEALVASLSKLDD